MHNRQKAAAVLCIMGDDIVNSLTDFDKRLLNILQGNLPLCSRPFSRLGEMLDTTEEHVLRRLNELKREGYLRRIGTFFNSEQLGYHGTLIALRVAEGHLADVAQAVNRYVGATHNYEREGDYNLWFTLLTPSRTAEEKILAEVAALPGVEGLMSLKANHRYKINVQFKLA
jgi:transcriptional regulator, AsnC family